MRPAGTVAILRPHRSRTYRSFWWERECYRRIRRSLHSVKDALDSAERARLAGDLEAAGRMQKVVKKLLDHAESMLALSKHASLEEWGHYLGYLRAWFETCRDLLRTLAQLALRPLWSEVLSRLATERPRRPEPLALQVAAHAPPAPVHLANSGTGLAA